MHIPGFSYQDLWIAENLKKKKKCPVWQWGENDLKKSAPSSGCASNLMDPSLAHSPSSGQVLLKIHLMVCVQSCLQQINLQAEGVKL